MKNANKMSLLAWPKMSLLLFWRNENSILAIWNYKFFFCSSITFFLKMYISFW